MKVSGNLHPSLPSTVIHHTAAHLTEDLAEERLDKEPAVVGWGQPRLFSSLNLLDFRLRILARLWPGSGTVGSSQVLDRPASFSLTGPASRLRPVMSLRLFDLFNCSSQHSPLQGKTWKAWLHCCSTKMFASLGLSLLLEKKREEEWTSCPRCLPDGEFLLACQLHSQQSPRYHFCLI